MKNVNETGRCLCSCHTDLLGGIDKGMRTRPQEDLVTEPIAKKRSLLLCLQSSVSFPF